MTRSHSALLTAAALAGGFGITMSALDAGDAALRAHPVQRGMAALHRSYGRLPIAFEANGGRTDKRVGYIARGSGYALFLTPGETVLSLSPASESCPGA
jgi:hypothetical protein